MEGEEKRREAGGWLSISLSTFCPAHIPGEGSAPFVLDPGATHSLLPPFLAFKDFF